MPSRSKSVDELLAEMKPWPKSWRCDDQDLVPGARLIADFAPFVRHLHADGMAPGTIRRHMNNLWELGGALIKRSRMDDPPEPIPPLIEVVDDEGGPLLDGTECEEDQRGYDATCKKLYRFLSAGPEGPLARRRQPTQPRRQTSSATTRELDRLIEEATVDAYGDSEQASGFLACFEQIAVPFTTVVLGVEVSVTGFDLTDDEALVAICRRGKAKLFIPVLDLRLPTPPPAGHEWIAAYRRWRRG